MSLVKEIVKWLSDYSKSGDFKLVVGVSGGIDSSVVSTLCCLTGIDTHVITLPIEQNYEQLLIAKKHINWLKNSFSNVKDYEFDMSNVFLNFKNNLSQFDSDLGWANSKSRLRMMTLYQISSFVNGIVVGTGNKVEDFGIGFFTKYGDGGVDISPIADLTKTEVRGLATELNILPEIINSKPTDGLWSDDRTDEDQIGATYEELEWAMYYIDNNENKNLTEKEKDIINIYQNFNSKNKHKMISIPIFKKK
jgi:NAD+ synthase